MCRPHRQSGIALMQTLMLSAILMTIVLSVAYGVKQHVYLAEAVRERTDVYLAGYSQKNEVLFGMLTQDWRSEPNSTSQLQRVWNFYDEPFEYGAGTVRIQDIESLLTKQLAGNEALGRHIAAAIQDWQDGDDQVSPFGAEQADYQDPVMVRNAPFQDMTELQFVAGVSSELYQQLAPISSVYPTGKINLLNMPFSLLSLYIGDDLAEVVMEQRRSNSVNSAMIAQLTGIPGDDFYTYNTGPIFRIKTTVNGQRASYSGEEIVILAPYSKIPVKIWDKRKTYQRIGNTQHNE